jgi:acyl dehydratase
MLGSTEIEDPTGAVISMMDDIFFEDVVPGNSIKAGPYVIPEQELIDFAAKWDPLPIHIDKAFAERHGGLTASGTYLLAVKMLLVHSLPLRRSVMASFGYDEVRFHRPARPGDVLMLELTWVKKRRRSPSRIAASSP